MSGKWKVAHHSSMYLCLCVSPIEMLQRFRHLFKRSLIRFFFQKWLSEVARHSHDGIARNHHRISEALNRRIGPIFL